VFRALQARQGLGECEHAIRDELFPATAPRRSRTRAMGIDTDTTIDLDSLAREAPLR
jgi:hypothetical protein